jgi:hypothetical protein
MKFSQWVNKMNLMIKIGVEANGHSSKMPSLYKKINGHAFCKGSGSSNKMSKMQKDNQCYIYK